jgi:putative PEP-CTERM system TPR-repeat lipoprotein
MKLLTYLRIARIASVALAASAGIAACGSKTADELVASAKTYLAKQDGNAGVIELRNALQKNPDLAEARFLLGKALLERNDPVGAAVELRKAHDLDYPDDLVLPLLTDALVKTGNFQQVLDLDSSSVLTAADAIAATKTAVARAHVALGDPVKAEQAVSAALQAKPGYSPALLLRARTLASSGNLDGAAKLVDDVLAGAPADAAALTLKGDIEYERHHLDGAVALYRRVLAGNPADLPANEALMVVLLEKADFDGARLQLDALTKALPGHPLVTYFRARLAAQTGELQAAEELVQEVLRLAPNDPHALLLGGTIATQRGEWTTAQQRLGKLVGQKPNVPLVRQMLARAYLRGGDPARALEVLEPLLQQASPGGRTLALAADAHMVIGDFRTAQQLFDRAAKLDSDSAVDRSGAALARVLGGDAEGLRQLEAIAASDRSTNVDMTLISALTSRRDYDGALKAIDRLEQKLPGKPLAPFLRGQILTLRGDLVNARPSFERALVIDPGYFPAIDRLAALDWREGKRDAARGRFEARLKTKPDDVLALVGLARLQEQAGAPKSEVAALFAKAVAARPKDGWARRQLVQYHLSKRDYKLALQAAQEAANALPNDPDLLALLGTAQLAAGEFNEAVSSFGKLAKLHPSSPEPLLGLADSYIASKSYDAAREAIERASALAPKSALVVQRAVTLDVLTGRFDSALSRARALQAQEPRSSAGFAIEGDLQSSRANWPAATAAYRAALQREPSSSGLAQRVYLSTRSSGSQSQADAFAAEWARTQPTDPQFPFFLAGLAIGEHKYGEAESQLKRSLRLEPDNAMTLNNLAWVLAAQNKPEALELAEKAYRLAPNQPLILDTLAAVLAERGQMQRALELQKKAVEIDPGAPGLRLTLARLYLKSGSKSDARQELNELAKLGDKFPQQDEVRGLLGQL